MAYRCKLNGSKECDGCGGCIPTQPAESPKITKGDRIRKMTDEELAEWLHNIAHYEDQEGNPMVSIYNMDKEKEESVYDSFGDLLEWLNEEV